MWRAHVSSAQSCDFDIELPVLLLMVQVSTLLNFITMTFRLVLKYTNFNNKIDVLWACFSVCDN